MHYTAELTLHKLNLRRTKIIVKASLKAGNCWCIKSNMLNFRILIFNDKNDM